MRPLNSRPLNVLSLFDGMSCGRQALDRLGIPINLYLASEIDKYAIKITQKNYPDTVQLGDVRGVRDYGMPKIDLLLAGSPCQGFSFAGKQLAFDDPRSVLFFEFERVLKEFRSKNPYIKFLLENVKMKKEYQDVISGILGVEPIEINSALVSAQNRKRLYWTNILGVEQPEGLGILLKDIVLPDVIPVCGRLVGRARVDGKRIDAKQSIAGISIQELEFRQDSKSNCLSTVQKDNVLPLLESFGKVVTREIGGFSVNDQGVRPYQKDERKSGCSEIARALFESADKSGSIISTQKQYLIHTDAAIAYMNKEVKGGRNHWDFAHHSDIRNDKSAVVVANFFKGVPYNVFKDWDCIRKFHPIECERLQTVKDNYTEGVSNTQRYRMLGNGWTIEVIKHILSYLPII